MKNFTRLFCIIFIFSVQQANGQNYLISFAGNNGAVVSSVQVENLNRGTSVTIPNGTDILNLTVVTGIEQIDYGQSSDIKIYPNPMNDNSVMQLYAPVAGNAIISVIDMTGRPLTNIQSRLDKGMQEFRLSGIKSGAYIVSVAGSSYQYSGKLLSNNKAGGTVCLEKISNNQAADSKSSITESKGVQATINWDYYTGDRLRFTGISGNNSTAIMDIPSSSKTIAFTFYPCVDGDNINYTVVDIGGQIWMKDNLKATKYNNGELIGTTTPANLNISAEPTPKYQWAYDGNDANVATYGRLYTWYAATDVRNACPVNFHVPTDAEWTTLTTYLLGVSMAGGKLKETGFSHWLTPNTGATNESGFTALPGGYRLAVGDVASINRNAYFWTASNYLTADAWFRLLGYSDGTVFRSYFSWRNGLSVRCLKNP